MKLEHIALYVDDLEAMRAFYCGQLGAKVDAKYRNPTTGFESYFLSFESGARVEIMSHPETVVSERHLKSLGYIHLAFSLGSRDAVDQKTRELAEAGVVVISQPRQTGDGYYESVILDPEGNQIELASFPPGGLPMTPNTPYHFKPGDPVLDLSGRPLPGYSLDGSGIYARDRVRAAPWRLKEWDFYQVTDRQLCLQLTIGHVSYAGNCNIMFFDHAAQKHLYTRDVLIPLPFRSMHMPLSARAESTLTVDRDGAFLRFETRAGVRHLTAKTDRLSAEVTLHPAIRDTITICTPFDKPNEFYFNEKINLLETEISLTLDGQTYTFDPATTFGLMDWGRGVWPFAHEWVWSSLSGRLNGRLFGFNLGCGFGNTEKTRGTENVVYYGDETIKLNQMRITHQADFMQPWQLEADDGRFSAVLTPHYDRATRTKMLFVDNTCHQMFGSFSGHFIKDDGQRVEFADLVGFAEHAYNHW